jgi:hypothetical protein
VNGNDRQTETEGSRVISNRETSQVSASSSRAKSATPITDEAGLTKIKFLISGTPANGPTISMLDVAQKLHSHVKKAIDGWNKKQKKGNWSNVCDVLRCVETRVQKFNVTRVPLHRDPEHKTACAHTLYADSQRKVAGRPAFTPARTTSGLVFTRYGILCKGIMNFASI